MKKMLFLSLLLSGNVMAATHIEWPPATPNPPVNDIPLPAVAKKLTYAQLREKIATATFDGIAPDPGAITAWEADFKARYSLGKTKICKYSRTTLINWLDNKSGVVDSPNFDNCDLSRLNLSKKQINNASINNTKIDFAKVGVFRNAHGFGASFYMSNLDGADFYGLKARMVLFQSSSLNRTRLNKADIRGAYIVDSVGKASFAGSIMVNSIISKSVLIEKNCHINQPKLSFCPGSSFQLASITGLLVDNAQLTNLDWMSARTKNVLIVNSNVSAMYPSNAISAKNFRIRESFRNYLVYANGHPYKMEQQEIGWDGDAYWNF